MTAERRYGGHSWLWGVAVVGGVLAGGQKIAAGEHYISDVLVGGAVGGAVGVLVPWLHQRLPQAQLSVLPHGQGGGALHASVTF